MIKSKLKVLLAINDMNQSELANRTGIRPQTITNIVNNKIRQIPVDALNAICEVLKCDVGDVFGYVEDEIKTAENPDIKPIDKIEESQETRAEIPQELQTESEEAVTLEELQKLIKSKQKEDNEKAHR